MYFFTGESDRETYVGASGTSDNTSTYDEQLDKLPPPIQCQCGNNCSLDDCLNGRCPASTMENLFPNLNVTHLSPDDKVTLIRTLTSETNDVAKRFTKLVHKTFKSLEAQEVPVKKVRAFALSAGKSPSVIKRYQESHRHELAKAEDVYDV